MITVQLTNFQAAAECRSILHSSKEAFTEISYLFCGGNVYGLISDFGCGSWGLATCLGGRCDDPRGTVQVNHEEADCKALLDASCFVSEKRIRGVNDRDPSLTVRECIERALASSKLSYTCQEIKELFHLSDGRFDRSLEYVSGEIWTLSAAIGFAANKEIYCFPWLNEMDLFRARIQFELGIFGLLKREGKIVLIPTSHEKEIKRYCDAEILFDRGRYRFKKSHRRPSPPKSVRAKGGYLQPFR
ncbi:MAG TPA: hypothetical protein PKE04_21580, partial [Clostridia bacterium]|nr:hypothetical protein [Clostridia bacterium]